MSRQTAVLDIGSSKVLCLICSPDDNSEVIVQGAGICGYKGYKNGDFVDEKRLTSAVAEAVEKAENEAKRSVRSLVVGVNAPFSECVLTKESVQVTSRQGTISMKDIDAIIDSAYGAQSSDDFDLMHSTPLEFYVNGRVFYDVPLNEKADTLEAVVSNVYVSRKFRYIVQEALRKHGISADTYISVPLAEGSLVIPPECSRSGALLVDCGYTHTDVSYVKNMALIGMKTINVGGVHFASDLSYGLNIPMAAAESIKRRYVYSLDYRDSIESIRIPDGGVFRVEFAAIQEIIEARANELAELVASAARGMGAVMDRGTPIYLTGGGIALMRGSCEFLEKKLNMRVRVNMPWMPRLSSPNYASAFAVMRYAMNAALSEKPWGKSSKGGFLDKLKGIFID